MKVLLNRKDGKKEYVKPFTVDTVDFENFKYYFQRGKKGNMYVHEEAYLDTETSKIKDDDGNYVQWIYQWAFLIGSICVVGRTVDELMLLFKKIIKGYGLNTTHKMLIYVHNLSYDWGNIESFLLDSFTENNVFLTDFHKILYADYDGLEFRCSWRLTGYSLDKLSQNYATTYAKATGTINYDTVRYPDTKLSNKDWTYMLSDVYSQKDGVRGYCKAQNTTPLMAQLTKTGFVRRYARQQSKNDNHWRGEFERTALTLPLFKMCKNAFSGGYTHGNRYHTGITIKADIGHRDFGSRYPATQYLDYFPRGQYSYYGKPTMDELSKLMKEYCCIFEICFENLKLKKEVTMPYLSYHKCTIDGFCIQDNGKLLKVDGYTQTTLTELDFDIIKKTYTWDDILIGDCYIWKRGLLPDWFRNSVLHFYNIKTELKGIEGKELDYLYGKENLNSLYGMTATNPLHDKVQRNDYGVFEKIAEPNEQEALQKYYENRNSFLPYQWAVWTTAHSRHHLFEAMQIIGWNKVLYSDTDSIFYLKDDETEKRIEQYNQQLINKAIKHKAMAKNNKGKIKYLGDFADEGDKIKQFRYLHSKCYAIVGKDGFKITVAGVTPYGSYWVKDTRHVISREEELQCIDNLNEDFEFKHCGGTCAKYIEHPIEEIIIDGHKVKYGNMVVIEPVSKVLSSLPTVDSKTGLPIISVLIK
ncbi:MAG: hypothetical protein J6S67_17500 [Methanobrevibacter sp.]|nr:hypothetical protein [Methanobrevibacter sp.]